MATGSTLGQTAIVTYSTGSPQSWFEAKDHQASVVAPFTLCVMCNLLRIWADAHTTVALRTTLELLLLLIQLSMHHLADLDPGFTPLCHKAAARHQEALAATFSTARSASSWNQSCSPSLPLSTFRHAQHVCPPWTCAAATCIRAFRITILSQGTSWIRRTAGTSASPRPLDASS